MDDVKEYLSQAYKLELRISSKMEQLDYYNGIAEQARSVKLGMRKNNVDWKSLSLDDALIKIEEIQEEISADINELVDFKAEVMRIIKYIGNPEYQTLLELRYLCNKPWEEIAELMGYSTNNVFKMHRKALENIRI